MFFSRVLNLGRNVPKLLAKKSIKTNLYQPKRMMAGHDVNYRRGPMKSDHPLGVRIGAEVIGGLMWWWILWHLWHEYEHIIGEFDYPDPSKWKDSELGIPCE